MDKPFKQIPNFNVENIKISIEDFIELQDLLYNSYDILNKLYHNAIINNDITFKYEEEDGTEISEEEALLRIKRYNEK